MSDQPLPEPLHIVQLAPHIAPGAGVAGVAYQLEREFERLGVTVERFTATDAGRRFDPAKRSPLQHMWDVVWFSTRGTRKARRFLARRPGAVSICHNDLMAGDIYVNHGVLQVAMRARGDYAWRMVRNPLHLFTTARDRIRYRGQTHRAFVALTSGEAQALRETYGPLGAPVTVIPNGVDLHRFRPATAAERAEARARLGADDATPVVLFIGHEFDRKGLPLVIAALPDTPGTQLVVVGGTAAMVESARREATAAGVADRVRFAGQTDPLPYLQAADALVLPSAYEANALVVLEALACGIPVIATPVGAAPDLVEDGVNGAIIDRTSAAIARALRDLGIPAPSTRAAARATAEKFGWSAVAQQYVDLARSLRVVGNAPPLSIVHAVRSDGFSGVERFIARLAVAQRAGGADVVVIGGDPARMRAELEGTDIPLRPARTTAEVRRELRAITRHGRVDIVNTHMTAADVAAVLAFAGRRGRPAVVSTRHFARPRRRIGPLRLDILMHRVIDAEISISRAVADAIGVPSTVVHPGLPPLDREPERARERVILVAQRLQPEKATDVAVAAFAASGLADEGWRLAIAGQGPERQALEAQVRETGLVDSVDFLGYRSDIADLMATAGLLIAPCPREGLGLAVLEAMRAGLPVVAADAGGHRDLLDGLDARALFTPGDPAEAGAQLRSLAGDELGRRALAEAAMRRQQHDFTVENQIPGTARAYYRAFYQRR